MAHFFIDIHSHNNGRIKIELNELFCGVLYIKFIINEKEFILGYDQAFDDPVPPLIQCYNALDTKNPISFSVYQNTGFKWSSVCQGDTVSLHLSIEDWDSEESFDLTLSRSDLMTTLNDFFKNIAHSPDFPFQYPFAGDIDYENHELSETREKLENDLYKHFEKPSMSVEECDDLFREIQKICDRNLLPLKGDIKELTEEYRTMLLTHVISD